MVLDSSFLVALYRKEDENNHKALDWVQRNKYEELLLSDVILFETLTVLNYKNGIETAKEAYDDMRRNKRIRIAYLDEQTKLEILEEFFNHEGKFSLPDASVIHLARKTDSHVVTFDKSMLRHAARK